MTITIQQHDLGRVAVLIVSGRLTLEGSAGAVEDAVLRAMNNGSTVVRLDVQNVSYVDSAGLGELVSAYARGLTAGVSVKVENATPKMKELLSITHLGELLLA
jgi:anti-sigma B factor antagonist